MSRQNEYVFASSAAQSVRLNLDHYQVYLMEDNQGAIHLASNPTTTQRSKHIDLRVHFVRDIVKQGKIILRHCPTSKQLADIFTKALPRIKFTNLSTQLLGITPQDFLIIEEYSKVNSTTASHIEGGVSNPMQPITSHNVLEHSFNYSTMCDSTTWED